MPLLFKLYFTNNLLMLQPFQLYIEEVTTTWLAGCYVVGYMCLG